MTNRSVPNHFQDPFGLFFRILRTGGKHGWFSVLTAGLSLAAAPLDLALGEREQRLMTNAPEPGLPILIVCGPPRSGTTLMAQVLARSMEVSYITNVMSMFPRSPIAASRLLNCRPGPSEVPLTSLYGRTAGFCSPNDGLPIWDRWLGSDRARPDLEQLKQSGFEIPMFFGALQSWLGRPVVTKNNAINAIAVEVSRQIPNAQFICMEREPLHLAQSLLKARNYIHGDARHPYGLSESSDSEADPVESVISQVEYHSKLAAKQLSTLGPAQFQMVSYRDLCENPRAVVGQYAQVLGIEPDLERIPGSFRYSSQRQVDKEIFERLKARLSGETAE